MANKQSIDEIIDPAAFVQLDKLLKQLGIAKSEFIELVKVINDANKAIASGKGIQDYETNINKIALAKQRLSKIETEVALAQAKLDQFKIKAAADLEKKVLKEIQMQEKKSDQTVKLSAKERLAEIKLEQDRKRAFDNYEKGVNKKSAADKKNAEQIHKNSRAYTILSNTLEVQRKKAQDLAVIYGETSPQFLDAAKGVIELDTRLKAIDKTLGKSQRFVGEYERANFGLSNSINQLTRELPALAINAQTFFLAISNNIPQFIDQYKALADEIKKSKAAAIADAEAKGIQAAATATAGGATQEAASAAGDLAKEQALAAAEALKTPGAFKQFLGSLFSLQTALSLGVTLLTLYGGKLVEYISKLIKGEDSLDAFKKKVELLNKAFEDGSVADAAKNINELRINIDLAKDGFLDKDKVVNQYNETIGKTTGEVKTLDEAEKALVKNGKAYVQMTLFKAAAQLSLQEAAKKSLDAALEANKETKEFQDAGTNASVFTAGQSSAPGFVPNQQALNAGIKARADAAKKAKDAVVKTNQDEADALTKIGEEFQKKAAAIAKANKFDFFGGDQDGDKTKINTDAIDLLAQRVRFEAESQKTIADNEKNSLDARLNALKNYKDASIRLFELEAQAELKQADLTKERVTAIKENQKNEVAKITSEVADTSIKINEDAEKKLAKLLKDGLKDYEEAEMKKIEALQAADQQRQLLLSESYDAAIEGVADQYAKGIINEKKYAQTKLDILRQYTLDSISEEIKAVERVIQAKKDAGLDTKKDEQDLSSFRKKLSKETADQNIEDLLRIAEQEEKLTERKKELARDVANLGVEFVNRAFENQKNKIQEEIDLNDERKERAIENINNSIGSEEEKADKIAIIEARSEANKVVLEKKQREIDQRKAKFQKLAAVAEIAVSTFTGVAKTQAAAAPLYAGLPFTAPLIAATLAQIPFIIASGAIQTAAVLATPIPQYYQGTESSKAGLALTDEKGPEGYITPDGKAYIGSNKPNIKNLEAGTKIIPHNDLVRMSTMMSLPQTIEGNRYDLAELLTEQKNTNKILNSRRNGTSSVITPRAWFNSQKEMNELDSYLKRNLGRQ